MKLLDLYLSPTPFNVRNHFNGLPHFHALLAFSSIKFYEKWPGELIFESAIIFKSFFFFTFGKLFCLKKKSSTKSKIKKMTLIPCDSKAYKAPSLQFMLPLWWHYTMAVVHAVVQCCRHAHHSFHNINHHVRRTCMQAAHPKRILNY